LRKEVEVTKELVGRECHDTTSSDIEVEVRHVNEIIYEILGDDDFRVIEWNISDPVVKMRSRRIY
jgi:hypothetical protein